MERIIPEWPHAPRNVRALSTLRGGGVSAAPYDDGAGGGGLNLGLHVGDREPDVMENRRLLRAVLPAEPVWLEQVHGTRVVDAGNVSGIPQADAAIVAMKGTVCAVMTADCLPVLLCDTHGSVVGAAHAGWRGLASGVLERTVAAMHEAGAENILAWLGPAIGPQSFEVGAEVVDAFCAADSGAADAFVAAGTAGKYLADIHALARRRLRACGVEQVSGGAWCTVRDSRFYSFRRDGRTGRMASLIWLE
jgi:YfiH family protein